MPASRNTLIKTHEDVTDRRQTESRMAHILMVIESMKLETSIRASQEGAVDRVHVREGESFDRDAVLVTLSQGQE